MPEWIFPEDWPTIGGTGTITTLDKDDEEAWEPKEKIPFGFQAPAAEQEEKPRRRRRRRRGKVGRKVDNERIV